MAPSARKGQVGGRARGATLNRGSPERSSDATIPAVAMALDVSQPEFGARDAWRRTKLTIS
jgi:hypothetical protein